MLYGLHLRYVLGNAWPFPHLDSFRKLVLGLHDRWYLSPDHHCKDILRLYHLDMHSHWVYPYIWKESNWINTEWSTIGSLFAGACVPMQIHSFPPKALFTKLPNRAPVNFLRLYSSAIRSLIEILILDLWISRFDLYISQPWDWITFIPNRS